MTFLANFLGMATPWPTVLWTTVVIQGKVTDLHQPDRYTPYTKALLRLSAPIFQSIYRA